MLFRSGFWGDTDGSRYRAAYFEDIPGVWRHGDWITITERGSCIITGRSDATLNRGGVRLGTAEFYTVVESLPIVRDSLVVHLEDDEGGAGRLLLFVVPAPGETIDDDARRTIAAALRSSLSPRHVPDAVVAVSALPRTLSGKKLEVPVKRILRGASPEQAAAAGALTDAGALEEIAAMLAPPPDADEWAGAMDALPDQDRAPIQQMTFTLHDDQAETIRRAMERARALGPFVDTGNENGNGNALARVAEMFLGAHP